MIFKDYYKILGLENSRVSASEIKAAYREQAKLYHPDVNGESTYSEERFKDINEAYRVLSEGNSKRKYDRMWNNYVGKKRIKYEEVIKFDKLKIVSQIDYVEILDYSKFECKLRDGYISEYRITITNPYLLYVEEVTGDPDYFINQMVRSYFNLNSIVLK